ncbi:MAG TPA: hypothetical protein PLV54_05510 [Anaerostipes hadrus]|jgi:hypothetical protein|nr:hypothetical protein [Anaerostipes hadrus]
MKKKVMVGLVSVVVAVALVFGGVTFYNNRQQEKFEKQMASYESVDTMQHPSEATTSIDGIQVPLGKKPKVTTKKTTKRRTTTSQNHSRRKVVNTKVVKTQKDYDKKGSKKRTIKTTTVELSQMSGVSGTTLRTLGSQADGKILNAFEDLKFKMVIDKNAEATGVFSVKSHKIALQSARSSVLLHELGHFANFLAGDKVGTSQWKSIYNAEKNKYDGYNKAYAIKSASEYFAESYKDYKEHPSALRSKRPRTYQFVKSTIDGITDSDVQNIKDTYGEYWGL